MKDKIYINYALSGRKIPKTPIFKVQNEYFQGKIIQKKKNKFSEISLSAFVCKILANCRQRRRAGAS
jgi:hypothetical protein